MKRLLTIDEIRAAVIPVARRYGIKKVALFGSYARGDATPESDVDIHISDKGALRSLFQLGGFYSDLEESLGTGLDVVTTGGLDDCFLEKIQKEEVVLYG
ncbi:MAG: nucleotidyltransferase domain-containing protein [Oscillospiraceae bacterium]|jgi:predicted nucleotidyltransferase|nr:nucleotidyltransferase domain-containing protein [Oscillospiraceae bacterium]